MNCRNVKYALAAISSLALFFSCLLAPLPSKEKIKPVGYGNVTPGGDLRDRIGRSIAALTVATGSGRALFAPDSTSDIAYRVGDALLGTVLMSSALGADDRLAGRIYGMIASRLNSAGYLGTVLTGEADEAQLAGHARLIRALCEYYRRTGDAEAIDMAIKICDGLFVPVLELLGEYPGPEVPRVNLFFADNSDEGAPSADTVPAPSPPEGPETIGDWTVTPRYGEIFTAIDAFAQLYGYKQDEDIKRVLEKLIDMYNGVRDDFPGRGTAGYLTAIRGMLRYDAATGGSSYEQDARQAWELFADESLTDMYGTGRTTPEGFGLVCPEDASAAYIAAMCLWAETGKGDYLQQAERIFYNTLTPSQTGSGKFTCLLSDTLDGRLSRYGGDAYGGPVDWVEALPFAVEYSYFIRDNKIMLPLYGDSELYIEEKNIRIAQRTGYPMDSVITIEVVEAPNRGIGLHLYFPSYMMANSIVRNGTEHLSGTVNTIGLLGMKEIYRKGDIIEFSYTFGPKWSQTGKDIEDDLYKPVYGPLLLGYRNDGIMWLERGVPLRRQAGNGFVLNPEFTYSQDTVTGKFLINTDTGVPLEPPVFKPVYEPLSGYDGNDIQPEYFLVRIGKD